MKRNMLLISIVSSYLGITGFVFGDAESDASDFLRQVKAQTKPSANLDLSPLPEAKPYEAYEYKGGTEDPFKLRPFVTEVSKQTEMPVTETECNSSECSASAPVSHAPYYLENFELSSLQMTGTMLSPNKQMVALIRTPDLSIQEARVGEYIGRNHGLIKEIKPDHIVIQEKYKVPRGWQDRMATLELF